MDDQYETLAFLPGAGNVRRCAHGCIHLTYAMMSLHFLEPGRFVEFVNYLNGVTPDMEGNARICYGWITLNLHQCALNELTDMAREALSHVTGTTPQKTKSVFGIPAFDMRNGYPFSLN